MREFTFLTKDQVAGDDKLDIMKRSILRCEITDFAFLLGGYLEREINRKNIGAWWIKNEGEDNGVLCVAPNGRLADDIGERSVASWHGARVAIPYHLIRSDNDCIKKNEFGIQEVEYGEYPQSSVNLRLGNELEKAYSKGLLTETGKKYNINYTPYVYYDHAKLNSYPEYKYNGKKYIRCRSENYIDWFLSDHDLCIRGENYWIEVEPIVWLVDKKANVAVSKKILFSGVQFLKGSYYDGCFENTDIKYFLDEYFAHDIVDEKRLIRKR